VTTAFISRAGDARKSGFLPLPYCNIIVALQYVELPYVVPLPAHVLSPAPAPLTARKSGHLRRPHSLLTHSALARSCPALGAQTDVPSNPASSSSEHHAISSPNAPYSSSSERRLLASAPRFLPVPSSPYIALPSNQRRHVGSASSIHDVSPVSSS
jgi:hypothetical protein